MAARLRLLVLLLLAGCAAPAEEASLALRSALASSQRNLAVLAMQDPAPAPPHRPMPAPGQARRVAHANAEPSGTSPTGTSPASAAQLLGARPETLRHWLGEPRLRRPEGSAEIWLYTAETCALDLVLYHRGGVLRVAHAAARASGTQPTTEDGCLRALAANATRPVPAATGAPPGRPEMPGV